jgi:two-component system C4-dicarboxylate transport sensor histidine kinase DctB
MRKNIIAVLLATVALATLATYVGANRYFEKLETKAASGQMMLYLRALNETLRQHQHLPFVLAQDPGYSDQALAHSGGGRNQWKTRRIVTRGQT